MRKKISLSKQKRKQCIRRILNAIDKHGKAPIFVFVVSGSTREQIALELDKMDDTELAQFADDLVTNINSNSSDYTTPDPALSAVSSQIATFRTSLTPAAKGDHDAVSAKDDAREELCRLVRAEAAYVLKTAIESASPAKSVKTLVEEVGLKLKKKTPPGPRVFGAIRTKISGKVKLRAPGIKSKGTHDWAINPTPSNANGWESIPSTVVAQTIIDSLTPGNAVLFRHRTVTKDGVSDWETVGPFYVS